jgi:hypothetical protein
MDLGAALQVRAAAARRLARMHRARHDFLILKGLKGAGEARN